MAGSAKASFSLLLLLVACASVLAYEAFEEAGIVESEDVGWNPLGADRMLLPDDGWEQLQQQQQHSYDPSSALMEYMSHPAAAHSDPDSAFHEYSNNSAFEESGTQHDVPSSSAQDPDYSKDEMQYHQEMSYHQSHGTSSVSDHTTSTGASPAAFEESISSSPSLMQDNAAHSSAQLDNVDYGGFSGDDVDGGDPEMFGSSAQHPEYQLESARIGSGAAGSAQLGELLSQMMPVQRSPAPAAASTSGQAKGSSSSGVTTSVAIDSSQKQAMPSSVSVKDVIYTGDGRRIDLSTAHQSSQQLSAASAATANDTAAAAEAVGTMQGQPAMSGLGNSVSAVEGNAATMQLVAIKPDGFGQNPSSDVSAEQQQQSDIVSPSIPVVQASQASAGARSAFEETNSTPAEQSSGSPDQAALAEASSTGSSTVVEGTANTHDMHPSSSSSSSSSSNKGADNQQTTNSPAGYIPTTPGKLHGEALYEAGQSTGPNDISNIQKSAAGLITARRATTGAADATSSAKAPGLATGATIGIAAGSAIAIAVAGYVIVAARARHAEQSHVGSKKQSAYPDIETAESYITYSNPSSPATSRKSRLAETSYAHDLAVLGGVTASTTRSPGKASILPFSKLHKGS